MELLQIQNLSFSYPEKEKKALDNVSLQVRAGEFVVLCGESGCGKTTLLRLLKRELSPFGEKAGRILYKGMEQKELDTATAAAEIGYVLQNPESQIVTDKVWHELAFGLESLGCPQEVIRRRVAEMASYFGIEDWFRKNTNDLSGGQKQLLNLASVMVMNPKLLLLDEPTAQLDPVAASNFINTLQKLNRELGLTILLVEHRLEEVFPIADRVVLMRDGIIDFEGSPRETGTFLRNNPGHKMLAGLPAAMKIYGELHIETECPLTVKEGRRFVTENFEDHISLLEHKPYQHSENEILKSRDVWFRYEKDTPDILRGISFSVYEGEFFCILGGNGCGKTTLLRTVANLQKPYRGSIELKGRKLSKYSEKELYRHNIALLPQNPQSVFLKKTVQEDYEEICRAMEYSGEEAAEKINLWTQKLGITHLLSSHPYDLSGGEQQKAALCKMLLLEPEILLLDEPTKGIDAYAKQNLSVLLKKLKEEGVTILCVTHDVEFAAENGDRAAMIFDGELMCVQPPTEFFPDNNFYTTAACRIARDYYKNAVTSEDVITLCRKNGRKAAPHD